MKPPRIPAYLRDAPLVRCRSRWGELAEVEPSQIDWPGKKHPVFLSFVVRDARFDYVWRIRSDRLVPLTETARQILRGEWR